MVASLQPLGDRSRWICEFEGNKIKTPNPCWLWKDLRNVVFEGQWGKEKKNLCAALSPPFHSSICSCWMLSLRTPLLIVRVGAQSKSEDSLVDSGPSFHRCGFGGLNSDRQAWWQTPPPTEPRQLSMCCLSVQSPLSFLPPPAPLFCLVPVLPRLLSPPAPAPLDLTRSWLLPFSRVSTLPGPQITGKLQPCEWKAKLTFHVPGNLESQINLQETIAWTI